MRTLTLAFFGVITFLLGAIAYTTLEGAVLLDTADPSQWQSLTQLTYLVMIAGPVLFAMAAVVALLGDVAQNGRKQQERLDWAANQRHPAP